MATTIPDLSPVDRDPARTRDESVRLVQFTDMHLYGDPDGRLRGVPTLPSFRAAFAHAAQRFPARDAILLTGDLVQDDPGGYRHVHGLLGGSDVPVLCLAGNHDVPAAMSQALAQPPFQVGGSREFDRWCVVLLDSWVANSAGGSLGSVQLQALDILLQGRPHQHVLICLHHQPIAMQSRWLDAVGLIDMAELGAVIERHANVRGVLWGHVHQALDTFVGGIRFMSTPSTCMQFVPLLDEFAVDPRPPAYRVLELGIDGSIATEVVWADTPE
jgi:Icc protein